MKEILCIITSNNFQIMVRTPKCTCPNAQSLFTILGKKWMMFIMYSVDGGAHTFTEIRKNIGEANTKILTDRLTELVSVGILVKRENGNYELSNTGKELSKKLSEVTEWWGSQAPECK